MNLYIWLPIIMLAATLTYALWCQLRPLLFEADIEAIRQQLWDAAWRDGQPSAELAPEADDTERLLDARGVQS